MIRLRRKGVLALATCVAFVLLTAPAQGAFHLMKIREISGSGVGPTNDAYVVLQMIAAGQNLVAGHTLTIYDEDAATGPGYSFAIPANVQFADTQRTILIGDTNVAGRDFTWDALSTAIGAGNFGGAGALCFADATPPDCVSWGTAFTGAPFIPDHATPFQAALPVTSALRRNFSPGCPTLLESSDDTNVGANDFAVTPREPRNNATVPSEQSCEPSPAVRCRGKVATLIGTAGRDNLRGTNKRDVIVARGGKDKVNGRGGKDLICGQGGRDVLKGGAAKDILLGDSGKDKLLGGRGKDKLLGGRGKDKLLGQKGRDLCNGGGGKDKAKACEKERRL